MLAIKITLLLHLFRQRYNHEDDESSTRSSSIIVAVNAFIVTTAVKTAVHHQFRKRYIDITGLKSSGDDNDDRWGEAVARTEDFQRNWDSDALLPLPENTNDQTIKAKSYAAMLGSKPTALDGRCNINFNYNNNNTTGSNSSNGNNSSTVQWLHVDPPVFVVDNFLTKIECQDILQLTKQQLPSDAGRVIRLESRTTTTTTSDSSSSTSDSKSNSRNSSNRNSNKHRISTTWYVRYGCSAVAPILNELIKLLPSINLNQIEEIQLVQYSGQKQGFAWHEDALLDDDNDEQQDQQVEQTRGGQRIATVLVYLDNECQNGSGRTLFRDLIGNNANNSRLAVSPKIGRALLFFPAITTGEQSAKSTNNTNSNTNAFGNVHSFDNTRADHRTIHAGEPPLGRNRNEDSD